MKELAGMGINVLSHRISPTRPPHLSKELSTLVLICEPTNLKDSKNIVQKLSKKLSGSDTQVLAGVNQFKITHGIPSKKSLYVLPKGFRGIRMPDDLKTYRDIYRRQLQEQTVSANVKKIFISHKFHDSSNKKAIIESLKEAINSAGCAWLDAPIDPAQPRTYHPIHARLWMADAAVIIALDDEENGFLSVNQAHEIGFMQGQRKPIRIVVSKDSFFDVKKLSNVPDTTMFVYNEVSELTVKSHPDSFQNKIRSWVHGETELEWDWLNQI